MSKMVRHSPCLINSRSGRLSPSRGVTNKVNKLELETVASKLLEDTILWTVILKNTTTKLKMSDFPEKLMYISKGPAMFKKVRKCCWICPFNQIHPKLNGVYSGLRPISNPLCHCCVILLTKQPTHIQTNKQTHQQTDTCENNLRGGGNHTITESRNNVLVCWYFLKQLKTYSQFRLLLQ